MYGKTKHTLKNIVAFALAIATMFFTIPSAAAEDSSTVVLTSYGPFARAHNSSEEVAEQVNTLLAQDNITVVYKNIPTQWSTFATNLEALVDGNNPDAIVSLGEVARIPVPKVEFVGKNTRYGADATGVKGTGPVQAAGPRERYAPEENKIAQQAAKSKGFKINGSYNAGTYLCNAALYTNLGLQEAGRVQHAAFVHVPARALGAPQISQDAEAVAAFVKALLQQ